MQYPKQTDNYDVEVFNNNFMQLVNENVELDEKLNAEKNRAISRENTIESDFNADAQAIRQLIDTAYASANGYTDEKIANLINGAPSTLDTLKEIADALEDNADVVQALNDAIGTKASQAELDTHINNETIHVNSTEKEGWTTPTFTQASNRENIQSKETLPTLFGKIKKWFSDLKIVAFTGSYNDLEDKPEIPADLNIGNGTLTIQRNGTNVQTFSANQSGNATANITVPTKTSDLTNDSGFKTTDTNTWKANTKDNEGYVAKGSGQANKVWKTDTNGNPAWRDDENTTYGVATTSANGLMSSGDKTKLDGIATGANKTTLTTSLAVTEEGVSALDGTVGKILNDKIDDLKSGVSFTGLETINLPFTAEKTEFIQLNITTSENIGHLYLNGQNAGYNIITWVGTTEKGSDTRIYIVPKGETITFSSSNNVLSYRLRRFI